MTRSELLTLIESVFFYPKKFSKTEICEDYQEYISEGYGYEGNAVANFFSGKTNMDITIESLLDEYPSDHTACLHFMTPIAASYFVGSFMHMAILNDVYGQDLRFNLMATFERDYVNSDGESETWFLYFTERQKSTIVAFIGYLETNYVSDMPVIDFKKARSNFMGNLGSV